MICKRLLTDVRRIEPSRRIRASGLASKTSTVFSRSAISAARRVGDFVLAHLGPFVDAGFRDDPDAVAVAAHDAACRSETSLATMKSAPFFFSLAAAFSSRFCGLGGEADDQIGPLRVMADAGEDVGVLDHLQRRRTLARDLLDLLAGRTVAVRQSATAATKIGGVGRQQLLRPRRASPRARLDMDGRRRRPDRRSRPVRRQAARRRRAGRAPRRSHGPACRTSGWRCSAPGRSAHASGRT